MVKFELLLVSLAVVHVRLEDVLTVGQSLMPDEWQGCTPPDYSDPELPFDCSQRASFPLAQYQADLANEPTIQAIVSQYDEPTEEATCPPTPPPVIPDPCENGGTAPECEEQIERKKRQIVPRYWYSLCPSWFYYPWRWGITYQNIGQCWVITPFSVHVCIPKYCWWGGVWPFYRCRQDYRRQYYLAYCPGYGTKFIYRWHLISRGCCCHRYFCCNNYFC